jgi:hypothetical protein
MPVVTMRYFQSDACREELSAYYENAKEFGVTQLIVPIVLAGSKRISSDHPDDLVRLIDGLNYVSIEDEWAAGYDSSDWVRIVNRMIANLEDDLDAAESSLTQREAGLTVGEDMPSLPASGADLEKLTEEITSTVEQLQLANVSMADFGDVLNEVMDEVNAENSPGPKQAKLVRGSHRIKDAAEEFASRASSMERSVAATDVQLRAVLTELRDIGTATALEHVETLTDPLHELSESMPSIGTIDDAIGGLRVASLGSISMRNALQPALRGMQSTRAGMATFHSWASA